MSLQSNQSTGKPWSSDSEYVDSPGQARGTYRNGFFEADLTSAIHRDKELCIHPRVNPWSSDSEHVDSPGQARGTYRNGFFEADLTSAIHRDKELCIHPRVNPWSSDSEHIKKRQPVLKRVGVELNYI